MNVVYIPNYNRVEFLIVNLELIAQTPEQADMYYLFGLDKGYRRNLLPTMNKWLQHHKGEIFEVPGMPQNYRPELKQSHAIVKGYQRALQHNPEYIFMIEDDVMVANTFFTWHYGVQKAAEPFVSIGTRNNNTMPPIPTGDCGPYYLQSSYESLGICWRAANLRKVLAYFTPHYFTNPIPYLRNNFKQHNIGNQFYEQDGLFNRYIQCNQSKVAWAHPPVSFHAGFFGKSGRAGRITGTIPEKVQKVKNIIFDVNKLKAHYKAKSCPDYYWQDSHPIPVKQKMGVIEKVNINAR